MPHPIDDLLPRPRLATPGEGSVTLTGPIVATRADADQAGLLTRVLGPTTGLTFAPADDGPVVVVTDPDLPTEGYRLDIGDDEGTPRVVVTACSDEGLVHACQTLLGLLPARAWLPAGCAGSPVEVPCCRVEDFPALPWRGLMVDVARHVQPLPWLFELVDVLARHKFNRLHLHLTDDQGWRFEVKAFPALTGTGSWRGSTRVLNDPGAQDGTPHGGFYTQDQLRALVRHAHTRGITIVPEIDVPGHVRSLLAAHPEFGDGVSRPVATDYGVFEEVLRLTPETVDAVEQIFTELLDVFDSPWIHIGGDECPTTQWADDSQMAELARQQGLEGPRQVQRWFTEHMRDWLERHGRTAVAWDEVIDHGEVPGAVVMSWRGVEPGQRAMNAGHPVVMCRSDVLYFDHYQSEDPTEPHAIGGHTPWQQVAALDPWDGVDPGHRDNLVGLQGQLWSEYLPDPAQVEYMAFPRASVLAELAWRGRIDDPGFEERLGRHVARLREAGVNARPLEGPLPWQRGGTGARRRA